MKILWRSETTNTKLWWAADRLKWNTADWSVHVATWVELFWSRRPYLRRIYFLKLIFIKVICFCKIFFIKVVWVLICCFYWALSRLICITRRVRNNRSFKFVNLVWFCQRQRNKCLKLFVTPLRIQKKNCIPTWLLPCLVPSLFFKFRWYFLCLNWSCCWGFHLVVNITFQRQTNHIDLNINLPIF